MVNLQDLYSLDISFDTSNNSFHFGEDVYIEEPHIVDLKSILPTLLNKSLHYPKDVYSEYTSVRSKSDVSLEEVPVYMDLIALPPGLLGIEFIKTHIYYISEEAQEGEFSNIVEVVYGELTVLLQKNKAKEDEFDFETRVDHAYVIKVKASEKFIIPKGYFYTFINSEEDSVVFVRAGKTRNHIDYTTLRREGGLAYYCIRKNARQEIVKNPLYKDTPDILSIPCSKFRENLELDFKKALYDMIKEQTKVLSTLLCNNYQ